MAGRAGFRAADIDQQRFDDSSLEYRRLFSGRRAFLLVVVAAGGGVCRHRRHSAGSHAGDETLAPHGMMVMGIIFFMGTISGAHLNPAVTLAFAARDTLPWLRVPGYIVAQFVGPFGLSVPAMGVRGHHG